MIVNPLSSGFAVIAFIALSGVLSLAKATCISPPSKSEVFALASLSGSSDRLLVSGPVVALGQSDFTFEIRMASLWLHDGSANCTVATVPIGRVTRQLSNSPDGPSPVHLRIQPLGTVQNLSSSIAFEELSLPQVPQIVIVHMKNDVKWGLSEQFIIPVTLKDRELIIGDRMMFGRDSFDRPTFFGVLKKNDESGGSSTSLIMEREGFGSFKRKMVFIPDISGALRVQR